jgi:hypothetical protein
MELVGSKEFDLQVKAAIAAAPGHLRDSMQTAVDWWYGQALPRVPELTSVLARSIQGYVEEEGKRVVGGLRSDAVDTQSRGRAVWLAAGTSRIAGGSVMSWTHGEPPITMWPAKAHGKNPDAALPILIPWWWEARDVLLRTLQGKLFSEVKFLHRAGEG